MRALVMTIFMYACETWTLTAELQRRIQALEFRCFRKILGISYKDRVTNEHVRETIVKHIGPYEDLLATVKRRKLKWYGHVTRSDGLSKVILQGTVEGSRRRGRPKKSWSDNIAEWTGKSFAERYPAETQAMAHNRQEWRELTRKSIMTRPYAVSPVWRVLFDACQFGARQFGAFSQFGACQFDARPFDAFYNGNRQHAAGTEADRKRDGGTT